MQVDWTVAVTIGAGILTLAQTALVRLLNLHVDGRQRV